MYIIYEMLRYRLYIYIMTIQSFVLS